MFELRIGTDGYKCSCMGLSFYSCTVGGEDEAADEQL